MTRQDSRALGVLASELDKTADRTETLDKNMQHLSGTSKELDRRILDTRRQVAALGDEFVRTGDRSLIGEANRHRATLKMLERTKNDIELALGDNRSGIGAMVVKSLRSSQALTSPGMFLAVGAALSPVIAGAIVGAAGVGGIAGGIIAASKDARVRSAASDLGDVLQREFFGKVGPQFVQPTIDALGILQQGVQDMHLDTLLAPLADDVIVLAKGVADAGVAFTQALAPGLKAAGPFIDATAKGLVLIAEKTGDMITKFAQSPGVLHAFEAGLRGVGDVIETVTGLVTGLGAAFEVLHDVNEATDGRLGALAAGVNRVINPILVLKDLSAGENPFQWMADLAVGTDEAANKMALMRRGAEDAAGGVDTLAVSVLRVTNSLTVLQNKQLAQQNAQLAWAQGLLNIKEGVGQHGTTLDTATQAGIDNQRNILNQITNLEVERDRLISELEAKRQAAEAAGESSDVYNRRYREGVEAVNGAYRDQVGELKRVLTQLGFTKTAIDTLLGLYAKVPRQIVTEIVVKARGSVGSAIDKASNVISGLFGGRHAGGHVWAGELYRVNELAGRQTEWFRPNVSGEVIPLGGGGSAQGPGDVNVSVFVGGQRMEGIARTEIRRRDWRDRVGRRT